MRLPAFMVFFACASWASADPVLVTASKTIAPPDTTITPTAGGTPVPLVHAEITRFRTTDGDVPVVL